jgi:hypothetical protein
MRLYSAVAPKPGRAFSEDVIGYGNGFYWLLDGATPPSMAGVLELTQRFLNSITSHLARLSSNPSIESPEQLLSLAIRSVRDEFGNIDSTTYFPYATAVLFRVGSQCIDYVVLGDSYLLIEIDGQSHVLCDDRMKHIVVSERESVRRMREAGISEQDPLYKEARNRLIECERAHLNRKDGFWVVSTDETAPLNGLRASLDINANSSILIMAASDGFARLSTHFGRPASLTELPYRIIAEGASRLLDELRTIERDKSNFLAPASSKHDDASFILVHGCVVESN